MLAGLLRPTPRKVPRSQLVTIVNGYYGMSENDWAFGDFTGSGTVDDSDITILNGLYGIGTTRSGLPQL